MSPSTTEFSDVLNEDNYFVWEFNARMKLAKKGLLEHIDATKAPSEGDANASTWKVNDMKAFANVCTMINPSLQSMVRTAETTAEAWEIFKSFFLCRSIHNRVQMRRQLHEFKMQKGGSVMDHFLKFDELCMSMQAIGSEISRDEQLVILLGSLSDEYDQIVKIIENMKDMDLFQAKEMLCREYESIARKESSEIALKAARSFKGKGPRQKETRYKFAGKCFICHRYRHKKQDCSKNPDKNKNGEQAFTVIEHGHEGWLLDSGASSHICPFRDEFVEIRSLKESVEISIANGETVLAARIGTIRVILQNKKSIRIEDVLFVPELDRRLLSISALSAKGLHVTFRNTMCEIKSDQEVVTQVTRKGKLFVLECETVESVSISEEVGGGAEPVSPRVWHARLGHLPIKAMKSPEECVGGFNIKDTSDYFEDQDEICEGCVTGKSGVKSFPKSSYGKVKTTSLLQVVHSDVMGPMETTSQSGARFVVTFLDDYSRYVVTYYITHKSDVVNKFTGYKLMMENQLSAKVKCIRTDNGGEYMNKRFAEVYRKAGIVHQATVPYSPQQNGMTERMNRTLTERARAMLNHMEVEKKWWAEAMNTAVYVTNRVTCASYPTKTPFKVCFGAKPDLSHMRVFGAQGYAHIDQAKRLKLNKKAFRCMFLGYSHEVKGYRVWNFDSKRVEFTRSGRFQELPKTKYVQVVGEHHRPPHVVHVDGKDEDVVPSPVQISRSGVEPMVVDQTGTISPPSEFDLLSPSHDLIAASDPAFDIDDVYVEPTDFDVDLNQDIVPRRGLRDFDRCSVLDISPCGGHTAPNVLPPSQDSQALVPVGMSGNITLTRDAEQVERASKRYRIEYEQANAVLETPSTYKEAMQSPQAKMWSDAIQAELQALSEKKTWTKVQKNPSQKVIGTKWVFAIKRNENGKIERFKARLVALGYRQTCGVDYYETYSPVANMNSIRVFLAVCCHYGTTIQQYDVDTAFINGVLEEDVYIFTPQGIDMEPNQVLKLNQSLYGLKQAAATCFKTISSVFRNMSFVACVSDPCVFVRQAANLSWVYVTLYVDDMLIESKSPDWIKKVADELSSPFKLKTLGKVRYILGIKVKYEQRLKQLKISQSACIAKMVEKFNQVNAKATYNPSVEGQILVKCEEKDPKMENRPYRSLVGSLLYVATGTRPDIAFVVCRLSRHLKKPSEEHWNAAIRVLRYLKSTELDGICYHSKSGDIKLSAFSDADWGSNRDNRRSTSGVMVMINNSPVIFKSSLQKNVSEYGGSRICGTFIVHSRDTMDEEFIVGDEY